jgi:hypothetical protein
MRPLNDAHNKAGLIEAEQKKTSKKKKHRLCTFTMGRTHCVARTKKTPKKPTSFKKKKKKMADRPFAL